MDAEDLDRLIEDFQFDIENLMELLKAKKITVAVWEEEFAALIATYNQAALMLGLDSQSLALAEFLYLTAIVRGQLDYLSNFALVIQSTPDFRDGWISRAAKYAQSIKTPYWQGAVDMLPLPAMPAQGTICQTNCGCYWDVEEVDAESGDFDCFWRRGKNDSCETCLEREAQWNPVRVRGWMLQ